MKITVRHSKRMGSNATMQVMNPPKEDGLYSIAEMRALAVALHVACDHAEALEKQFTGPGQYGIEREYIAVEK